MASFYVRPLLVDQIKEGQKKISEMIKLRAEIEGGRKLEFQIRDDGVIVRGSRMCVPEIGELKKEIMEEAHSSAYAMHPGSTKMYHTLREHYWWKGMKKEIADFVSRCLTCQQVKVEHQKPKGKIQPLPIPVWKWIVDRLTKSTHFLPVSNDDPLDKLAQLYVEEIVRLHGVPISIVSDRDPRFPSRFWSSLQDTMGSRLHFSTTFHPQTEGQS